MTLTLPVVLLTVAFIVLAIESARSKSLLAIGLALAVLAFAIEAGLKL